jgi:hypothetical protein
VVDSCLNKRSLANPPIRQSLSPNLASGIAGLGVFIVAGPKGTPHLGMGFHWDAFISNLPVLESTGKISDSCTEKV